MVWRIERADEDTRLWDDGDGRLLLSDTPFYPVVGLVDEEWALVAAAPDMAADGAFLLARLDEFEMALEGGAAEREFYGHISPAMARFRAAIAKAERGLG